jgi:hypothetical protein
MSSQSFYSAVNQLAAHAERERQRRDGQFRRLREFVSAADQSVPYEAAASPAPDPPRSTEPSPERPLSPQELLNDLLGGLRNRRSGRVAR